MEGPGKNVHAGTVEEMMALVMSLDCADKMPAEFRRALASSMDAIVWDINRPRLGPRSSMPLTPPECMSQMIWQRSGKPVDRFGKVNPIQVTPFEMSVAGMQHPVV